MIAYYTAPFNAVDCSVHLHGPSRLPAVNCFSIMTVAKHIMTTAKDSHVFRITPQEVRSQRIWLLSDVNVFAV